MLGGMIDDRAERESALRTLPLPYSLALRLRDAGVATDVVSEYLAIDEAGLDGFYRMAEAKLASALRMSTKDPGQSSKA